MIKSIIRKRPFSNVSWRIVQLGFILRDILKDEKSKQAEVEKKLNDILSNPVVLNGPFKGMKYVNTAIGSAFLPKIIGSYEAELNPVIEALCNNSYNEIFDIGCAEGYYAIGMALRHKDANVYAFDIDEEGRNLCKQMAKLNGFEQRVFVREACTPELLATHQFKGRNLIIADCEGYELHLFTKEAIENLSRCDVLIESHDFIDIHISSQLTDMFATTHNLKIVTSLGDIQKAKYYNYPEVSTLTLTERYYAFRENRPTPMEWLILTPKSA